MKKVIIAGGTGMVGRIVLREALESVEVGRIISLSRRTTGIDHPKLTEVLQADFSSYAGIEDHFRELDAAYFCIGVYTGQVPDAEFRTITVDYTKAFADALLQHSPHAAICFLSGQGADPKEESRLAFAKYKGRAENDLISRNFGRLHIFRPAYIYPVEKRQEPNFSYRIFRRLYPLIKNVFPGAVITSEQLGQAIFTSGLQDAGKTILENEDIKTIVA